jgi:hypothetical protein
MKSYSILFLFCFVFSIDAGIKEKFISLGAHTKKALISGKEMMHAGMKEKVLPAIKRAPGSFFSYGKGLKNDIVTLRPNRASMKYFIKTDPFLCASFVHEGGKILYYIKKKYANDEYVNKFSYLGLHEDLIFKDNSLTKSPLNIVFV